MPRHHVHVYRELRLVFADIEAESAEEAAALARDRDTADADAIEDCNGETFAALIDVAGDEEYEHSRMIDFAGERLRRAAPLLLEALQAGELQLREYVHWHHAHAGGCSVEIEDAWEQARDARATATRAHGDREVV